mmetsp:Transcript_11671/g.46987  ORF Transcript_11671/g.46987 Transcript_11671/m.46987 type:complete len:257 (+) Transcript_11671:1040-1810(+)
MGAASRRRTGRRCWRRRRIMIASPTTRCRCSCGERSGRAREGPGSQRGQRTTLIAMAALLRYSRIEAPLTFECFDTTTRSPPRARVRHRSPLGSELVEFGVIVVRVGRRVEQLRHPLRLEVFQLQRQRLRVRDGDLQHEVVHPGLQLVYAAHPPTVEDVVVGLVLHEAVDVGVEDGLRGRVGRLAQYFHARRLVRPGAGDSSRATARLLREARLIDGDVHSLGEGVRGERGQVERDRGADRDGQHRAGLGSGCIRG